MLKAAEEEFAEGEQKAKGLAEHVDKLRAKEDNAKKDLAEAADEDDIEKFKNEIKFWAEKCAKAVTAADDQTYANDAKRIKMTTAQVSTASSFSAKLIANEASRRLRATAAHSLCLFVPSFVAGSATGRRVESATGGGADRAR